MAATSAGVRPKTSPGILTWTIRTRHSSPRNEERTTGLALLYSLAGRYRGTAGIKLVMGYRCNSSKASSLLGVSEKGQLLDGRFCHWLGKLKNVFCKVDNACCNSAVKSPASSGKRQTCIGSARLMNEGCPVPKSKNRNSWVGRSTGYSATA